MDNDEIRRTESPQAENERQRDAEEPEPGTASRTAGDIPFMELFYENALQPPLPEASQEDGMSGDGPAAVLEIAADEAAVTAVEVDLSKVELPVQEEEPPTLSDEELSQVIEDLCRSKAEEFRMIGYEHVVGKEIWDCVSDKYRKTGIPPLYKIVNDILSLKVTSFMNWLTMSAFKDDARFR